MRDFFPQSFQSSPEKFVFKLRYAVKRQQTKIEWPKTLVEPAIASAFAPIARDVYVHEELSTDITKCSGFMPLNTLMSVKNQSRKSNVFRCQKNGCGT